MPEVLLDSLRCERLRTPLGLDERRPRLGWVSDCRQAAYQVVVAKQAQLSAGMSGAAWDSGWVESGACSAEYAGEALEPRTRYWWSVRVRDHAGKQSGFREPSWFETGLFESDGWPSEWLRAPTPVRSGGRLFLRELSLARQVDRARAYVAGLGYHEMRVNGVRSGENVLDPAWTDYGRKIYYVTHDITAMLRQGANTVAVTVASGRYRDPVLNARIYIELDDGTSLVDNTDRRTWRWSPATPVAEASLYDGESHDARIVVPGWDAAAAGRASLLKPLLAEPPGGAMVAQNLEPIRVVDEIKPIASWEVAGLTAIGARTQAGGTNQPAGTGHGRLVSPTVFDLGQNIAGWARIRVRAVEGRTIRLLFSEALRDDHQVELKQNGSAKATDTYVAGGSGSKEWEPAYTYHGFRYVQVEADGPVDEFELTGRVVRSAVSRIGEFRCSDELASRLRTACEWTEGDNLHSLPTDCPQREERMGWLNDMAVRAESALYTFDLNLLYAKWAEDIAQAQGKTTGAIPDVAPLDAYHTPHFGNRPADPVSSSYLLICWLSYLHYGDRRLLERRYNGLVRWYQYLADQADGGILDYSYWGDWASPQAYSVEGSVGAGAVSAITPGALVSTSFLSYDAALLSKIARAIGRTSDAARFAADAGRIRAAFNSRFYAQEQGWYGSGSQACQAIPLAHGIVPEDRAERAVDHLAADIVEKGTHLSTGNIASRYVPEVLCDFGRVDLAWDIVTQRTYPSWGYMMDHGATTIWERWEHIRGGGMSSHNHPMYATVSGWFSKYVGGIRASEEDPGFATVVIRPFVPEKLSWAEASLQTVRGAVKSSWHRRDDGDTEFDISIPPASLGRIEIPVARGFSPEEATTLWAAGESRVVRRPGKATPTVERSASGVRLCWEVAAGEHRIVVRRR